VNARLLVRLLVIPLPGNNPGQVVYVHVPFLTSSIIWYCSNCWKDYGSMWEVWLSPHIFGLCLYSLLAQGLGNSHRSQRS